MPISSTHPEVTSPSNTSDNTKSGQKPIPPHVTMREKKSKAFRRRAACPVSHPLLLEEHPSERIRSNTVATHLDHTAQDTLKPPTPTRNDHSGRTSVHPILLVRLVTLPV